jgi:hypothetical protein
LSTVSSSKKRKKANNKSQKKQNTKKLKLEEVEENPLKNELKKKTLKQLQNLLRINNQLLSGTKDELVVLCFSPKTQI